MTGSDELAAADREAPKESGGLARPSAHLCAWLMLAVINAVVSLPIHATEPWSARLQLHAYDSGHHFGLGLLLAAAMWLWRRFAGARRTLGYGVATVAALAGASLVLPPDLSGWVERLPGQGLASAWNALLILVAAASLIAGAVVAERLAQARWRWIGAVAGLAAMVGNHFVLIADYPGIHLWVALGAAVVVGQSLLGVKARLPAGRWAVARRALLLVAVLGSATTFIMRPPQSVWQRLFRSNGSVVAPQLARIYAAVGDEGSLPIEPSRWFQSREKAPAVVPTQAYQPGPDTIVILLTVDALRADLVEDEKYAKQLPALHALKASGVHFSQARSPASGTSAALNAILRGKFYSQFIVPSPRVSGLVTEAGVRSMHFLAEPRFDIPSFGRFDEYFYGIKKQKDRRKQAYATALQVFTLLIDRLRKGVDGPAFLYSHLLDPHAPYTRGGRKGTQFERYVREVQMVDRQLDRLMRFLEEADLWKRTVLMVSADHGEAFGEHGHRFHSVSLYEEVVRVPLLIRGPGIAPKAVATPVTLLDLAPTILDIYDLPAPGMFMGESLAPVLAGRPGVFTRPIALDTSRRIQAMVFSDGVKAIIDLHKKTSELYDLEADPGEKINLVDSHPKSAQHLATLRKFFAVHTPEGYTPPRRRF